MRVLILIFGIFAALMVGPMLLVSPSTRLATEQPAVVTKEEPGESLRNPPAAPKVTAPETPTSTTDRIGDAFKRLKEDLKKTRSEGLNLEERLDKLNQALEKLGRAATGSGSGSGSVASPSGWSLPEIPGWVWALAALLLVLWFFGGPIVTGATALATTVMGLAFGLAKIAAFVILCFLALKLVLPELGSLNWSLWSLPSSSMVRTVEGTCDGKLRIITLDKTDRLINGGADCEIDWGKDAPVEIKTTTKGWTPIPAGPGGGVGLRYTHWRCADQATCTVAAHFCPKGNQWDDTANACRPKPRA